MVRITINGILLEFTLNSRNCDVNKPKFPTPTSDGTKGQACASVNALSPTIYLIKRKAYYHDFFFFFFSNTTLHNSSATTLLRVRARKTSVNNKNWHNGRVEAARAMSF